MTTQSIPQGEPASLSEHLAPEVERERFTVDGPQTALWALRKLAQAKAKQVEVQRLADDEVQRIAEWRSKEWDRHQHDVDYFEGLLTGWHRQTWESGDERKTINLPGGALKRRAGKPKVVVTDPAFVTWALEHHPGMVRTKHEPDLLTIANATTDKDGTVVVIATGEVVPNVELAPGEVRWTVEVDG